MNSSLKIRTIGNLVQIGHLLFPQPTTEANNMLHPIRLDRSQRRDKAQSHKTKQSGALTLQGEESSLFRCWAGGRNVLFEPALFNSGAACAQHAGLARGPFAPGRRVRHIRIGPPGSGTWHPHPLAQVATLGGVKGLTPGSWGAPDRQGPTKQLVTITNSGGEQ